MSTSDGSTRKHSHYHKDVGHLLTMDVYRLCERFEINDPSGATQHAIKKLVCAGQRGSKGLLQDLQEAVDTINRRIEMIYEDKARDALLSTAFGQQNMIDPAGVDIAREIDDDSERMQAIGQQNQLDTGAMRFETVRDWVKWAWNGSFIPGNPREEAVSAVKRSNGRLIIRELGFQAGPFKDGGFTGKGCLNASPVGGPMLRCHDCIAEHCPCVAK